MLITLLSVKSCAVTTTALALTATWPASDERVPILAEMDPAGGDIGAQFGLGVDIGIVTLAAAVRRAGAAASAQLLGRSSPHLQELPGGTRVLTAPVSGRQGGAALDVLADELPVLARTTDVLADCGRLGSPPADSVSRLLARSDVTVLVVDPQVSPLLRLIERLPEIRRLAEPLAAILCGDSPFALSQVAEELGIPVVGHLPADADAAALLRGQTRAWRRPHRLPLFRAASAAAAAIVAMATPRVTAEGPAALAEVGG